MDYKITKKRLNNFFAYEWLGILAVFVAVFFACQILFGIFSVKLTIGQSFKFYYDFGVSSSGIELTDVALYNHKTFSYDVLSVDYEILTADESVLKTRLAMQEGDAIFTYSVGGENDRAKKHIDNLDVSVYDFETLLSDSKSYIRRFLNDENAEIKEENLSGEKIRAHFLDRMKKDNRYKTESQKEQGILDETDRIKRLIKETDDFQYLLSVGDSKDLFLRYTRFDQTINSLDSSDANYAIYSRLRQDEINAGRENAVYGLNMAKLTGENANHLPQEFVKIEGFTNADGVVLMVYNFLEYQKDLQFEVISFINTFVRECSDIYEGR